MTIKQILISVFILNSITINIIPMENRLLSANETSKTTIIDCEDWDESKILEQCKNTAKKAAQKSQRPYELHLPMWGSGSITIQPTAHNPLTISTSGLGGCAVTVLHSRYNDNEQYAGMTHYPPSSSDEQINDVKKLLSEAVRNQHKTKKMTAINFFTVVPATEWKKNNNESKPVDQCFNDLCNSVLLKEMTPEEKQIIKIHCLPYSMSTKALEYHYQPSKPRDVEVQLHPNGKASITLNRNDQYENIHLS